MWLKIFVYCIFWLHVITTIQCHLPPHLVIKTNKIEAACSQAKKCIHDTIPICGRCITGDDENKKRTFFDLCDLFEYVCDNEEVWRHTPDEEGCPPKPEKNK